MIKNYYGLRCPYCDKELKDIKDLRRYSVFCPECEKKFTIYQVISYNMWLAENKKATKLDEKPSYFSKFEENDLSGDDLPPQVKDMINSIREKYNIKEINVIKHSDLYLNKEFNKIEEDENLDFEKFERVHDRASETAAICYIQYNYLIACGFNDRQAMHILDKLIENDIIFYGGILDE